jgi:cyclophilin family peptidyl-prolyl cis-trans isomerase
MIIKLTKAIVLLFLFSVQVVAQYSEDDYELVKTTYQRIFDKEIIDSYLYSEDTGKIKAALLSISHSEDTTFIPLITSLPFEDYLELICFAIGQIGPSYSSQKFLWERTNDENFPEFSTFIFEAIGKVGNEEDLNKIVELYPRFDAPTFPYDGISLAIMQFSFRGIKSETSKQILIDEITNPFNSVKRKSNALFALARIGGSSDVNDELKRILLLPSSEDADTIQLKQFALMNFRTQKFFSDDENVFIKVLQGSNILLQIETARAICYKNFKTIAELDLYLNLINSDNPNVSRAAANSLQNLSIRNIELQDYLKNFLIRKILTDLPQNTRGELFSSLVKLYHPKTDSFPQGFYDKVKIPEEYWNDYYGSMTDDSEVLSKLLHKFHSTGGLSNKISLLENLLKFQKTFPDNTELNKTITSNLSSEYAPLVSIAADGIDSILISKNESSLTEQIKFTINKEKDNPDFMEGTMSLVNLAQRIDSSLFSIVVEELSSSNLYSIRKFIFNKTGKKLESKKPSNNFDEIWKNSFAYKTAIVETVKGNFTIEFLPEFAPVSVGNFCMLAEKDFFDGIEFHRVVPGFVIQGGDPTATGWGGPGYDIISEFSPLPYKIGMVGMASAGKDTEGSQWFVMQGNYPHLNGRYTIFAKVISGIDVVYKTDQNDKILNVKLLP